MTDDLFPAAARRRDLTTGQKALAYALLYPEKEKTGPKADGQSFPINGEIPTQRISDARAILKYAPGDVEAIKQGDEAAFSEDATHDGTGHFLVMAEKVASHGEIAR